MVRRSKREEKRGGKEGEWERRERERGEWRGERGETPLLPTGEIFTFFVVIKQLMNLNGEKKRREEKRREEKRGEERRGRRGEGRGER